MLKQFIGSAVRSLGYNIVKTKTLEQLIAGVRIAPIGDTQFDAVPIDSEFEGSLESQSPDLLDPAAQDPSLSAHQYFQLGEDARKRREEQEAFRNFGMAISLIPRYEPARNSLAAMSNECIAASASKQGAEKLGLLVRALEMNPLNAEIRELIQRFLSSRGGRPDLTQMCFIFYDGERAHRIHEEAYKRALEFVTIGGIPGAVMEFGVLGGWSARILCEIMRDIFNFNNVYLFDSFEGLPEYVSAIDRESYEISGRNVWSDKMKFPADFLEQFGQPHQWHIRDRLSEIIRPERIIVRLHTTKTVGLPHARGLGELYDGVA